MKNPPAISLGGGVRNIQVKSNSRCPASPRQNRHTYSTHSSNTLAPYSAVQLAYIKEYIQSLPCAIVQANRARFAQPLPRHQSRHRLQPPDRPIIGSGSRSETRETLPLI